MSEQTILEIGTIILNWDSWVPSPDILMVNSSEDKSEEKETAAQ
jgi:hypothetical protein